MSLPVFAIEFYHQKYGNVTRKVVAASMLKAIEVLFKQEVEIIDNSVVEQVKTLYRISHFAEIDFVDPEIFSPPIK